MKTLSSKVSKRVKIEPGDLYHAWLKEVREKNDNKQLEKSLSRMLTVYMEEKTGIPIKDISFDEDFSGAEVTMEYNESDIPKVQRIITTKGTGYGGGGLGKPKTYLGFYESASRILRDFKAKKKSSATFNEFYDRLLKEKDGKGNLLFIKNGEEISIDRVMQYLTKSQIERQSNMTGVVFDRRSEIIDISKFTGKDE